jgi:hypothetical protein
MIPGYFDESKNVANRLMKNNKKYPNGRNSSQENINQPREIKT